MSIFSRKTRKAPAVAAFDATDYAPHIAALSVTRGQAPFKYVTCDTRRDAERFAADWQARGAGRKVSVYPA